MTREEKIKWLENAEAEELLSQYNSSKQRYDRNPLDGENRENLQLTRAEMIKRLTK